MSGRIQKLLEKGKCYLESLKRGDKKVPKDGMLILFLSGILIYVILLPTGNNSSYHKKTQKEAATTTQNTADTSNRNATAAEYQTRLEEELEEFLSGVEGVGEVKVLIYMRTSEEYVVEKDQPVYEVNREGEQEKTTESQREETTVYTTNDNGEQVPFVAQTKRPQIEGIVIAAQGASDENLRVKLIRMAMALYGVEANKVEVLTLSSKK